LHDRITQPLCAAIFRSQALADKLSLSDAPLKKDAGQLREIVARAAHEVVRIARNLRPTVLNEMGLAAALQNTSPEFAARTGLKVKLTCAPMSERLPADVELTLFRVFQEAMRNVEKHASASTVTVQVTKHEEVVKLAVKDDGIGFGPDCRRAELGGVGSLGMLSMRERANSAGGTLAVRSEFGAGTQIEVSIPLMPVGAAGRPATI
jgi:two-component system NarL family sensor kinase